MLTSTFPETLDSGVCEFDPRDFKTMQRIANLSDMNSQADGHSQIETAGGAETPSDDEIMARVWKIRSSWTVEERLRRRHDAEARFAELMLSIGLDAEAA